MIDPESLYFRGAVKVLLDMYQVPEPEILREYLQQHADLAPILLETHYLSRPFFDFGLPSEILLAESLDMVFVNFGVPDDFEPKAADKLIDIVTEIVWTVPRPDLFRLNLHWIPINDK